MNTLKKFSFLYIILAAVFLLSACIPTGGADIGTTIDATQAAEMIAEAVAQALDAQATQIAETVPLATATVAPTNTAIPAAATNTPAPTITPLVLAPTASSSGSGGSGGSSGATVTYPDACDPDVGKRPYDLSEFKAGDTFDIKFTIVNTGTSTWPAGHDLIYNGGPDMTNGGFATVQLPEMKPGASFSVGPYDAWAPNESGRQVMQFKLEGGFCYPYVAIIVKQKKKQLGFSETQLLFLPEIWRLR